MEPVVLKHVLIICLRIEFEGLVKIMNIHGCNLLGKWKKGDTISRDTFEWGLKFNINNS